LPQTVTHTVPVVVPVAIDRPLSYGVPEGISVKPGTVVRVPLGPRVVLGAVWDGKGDKVEPKRLKSIVSVVDTPPLDASIRRFIDWVAEWTLSPPGTVLRMVLRNEDTLLPEKPVKALQYMHYRPHKMTSARQKVLDYLEAQDTGDMLFTRQELAEKTGVSAAVIDGLVKANALQLVDAPKATLHKPDADYKHTALSDMQQQAADALQEQIRSKAFHVSLLEGVTGSGKTEVFFEAVAETLRAGRQVLILMPEIALTTAILERFEKRFGVCPGEWHSDIAAKSRSRIWRGVAENNVRVVIGARSALYLPFKDLGLIVVDEEHEAAYKQEDRVFYNARDMAVVRGRLAKSTVILASATPSVETRYNADCGRYTHLRLPSRFALASLPDIQTIDMKQHPPERGSWLSPPLVSAVQETLENGEQSLLFLNRRGYAPLTLCRTCGHRIQCPCCSAWLVEHRFRQQLVCHHCGYHEPVPTACPSCHTEGSLVACGPGVERIAEEVASRFDKARVLLMSSDMPGGVQRLRDDLQMIHRGEVDIIIGTQLVAKGHHFPQLTLVGVVDADIALGTADPRAGERTFQMLSQVTGRAGRESRKGRGLIQTYSPDHPALQAILSHNARAFYEQELRTREAAKLPPFGRIASLTISAGAKAEAERYAKRLLGFSPREAGISVLGPAEPPLAVIRGRHRMRLLVQGPRGRTINHYLRRWMDAAPPPKGNVKVQIDTDPQSFV
jgi:primosomal protein N' (replication factor Y)